MRYAGDRTDNAIQTLHRRSEGRPEVRRGMAHPWLYADIHGLARPGNLVPATVAPASWALAGKRVAVVGVPQISDYDAESTRSP